MVSVLDVVFSLLNLNLTEDDIKELEDTGFKVFKTLKGSSYRINFIDFDRLIVIVSPSVTVMKKEKEKEVITC